MTNRTHLWHYNNLHNTTTNCLQLPKKKNKIIATDDEYFFFTSHMNQVPINKENVELYCCRVIDKSLQALEIKLFFALKWVRKSIIFHNIWCVDGKNTCCTQHTVRILINNKLLSIFIKLVANTYDWVDSRRKQSKIIIGKLIECGTKIKLYYINTANHL